MRYLKQQEIWQLYCTAIPTTTGASGLHDDNTDHWAAMYSSLKHI